MFQPRATFSFQSTLLFLLLLRLSNLSDSLATSRKSSGLTAYGARLSRSSPEIVSHVLHNGGELKRVVTLGSQIELACPVEGGDDVYFEWSKDGSPVSYSPMDGRSRMRITSRGSLKIKRVNAEDEGHFVCTAMNAFGRTEVRTSLLVFSQKLHEDKQTFEDEEREREERHKGSPAPSSEVMKEEQVTGRLGNNRNKKEAKQRLRKSDVARHVLGKASLPPPPPPSTLAARREHEHEEQETLEKEKAKDLGKEHERREGETDREETIVVEELTAQEEEARAASGTQAQAAKEEEVAVPSVLRGRDGEPSQTSAWPRAISLSPEQGLEMPHSSPHHISPQLAPTLRFVAPRGATPIRRREGSTLRLKCVPAKARDEASKATIIWLWNGSPLKMQRAPRKGRGKWSLTLEKITAKDSGDFTCLLSNKYGVTNASFLVDIISSASGSSHFDGTASTVLVGSGRLGGRKRARKEGAQVSMDGSQHPVNSSVGVGGSATFQCTVRSDVLPHIQWLKRIDGQSPPAAAQATTSVPMGAPGQPLALPAQHRQSLSRLRADLHSLVKLQGELFSVLDIASSQVHLLSEPTPGVYVSRLLVTGARASDAGKYICLGANSRGYSFRSAFLSVESPATGLASAAALVSGAASSSSGASLQQPSLHHHHHRRHNSLGVLSPHLPPELLVVGVPIVAGILVAVALVLVVNCYKQRSEPHIPDLSDPRSDELDSQFPESNLTKELYTPSLQRLQGTTSIGWFSINDDLYKNYYPGGETNATRDVLLEPASTSVLASPLCGVLPARHQAGAGPGRGSSQPPPCCEECECGCGVNHNLNRDEL